jgi:hypothetical protein
VSQNETLLYGETHSKIKAMKFHNYQRIFLAQILHNPKVDDL